MMRPPRIDTPYSMNRSIYSVKKPILPRDDGN
jgi:hypothetical protein